MAPEKLWTVKELADYLNVLPLFVYNHAASGDIPSIRIGRYLRFDPARIRAWIAESEKKQAADAAAHA